MTVLRLTCTGTTLPSHLQITSVVAYDVSGMLIFGRPSALYSVLVGSWMQLSATVKVSVLQVIGMQSINIQDEHLFKAC